KRSLGKGISALIPPQEVEVEEVKERILYLKTKEIRPSPYQPREAIDPQELGELAQSIKEKGVIQPILVRKKEDGFELIAGERRWKAACFLNLEEIPALVKEVKDEECLELALIENIQRQDLNPIEQAKAFQYLINKFGLTHEGVAQILGKARVSITNILRLLKLSPEIQNEIKKGGLSFGHARALLEIGEPDVRRELMGQIIAKSLSVNELENLIRKKKKKSLVGTRGSKSKDPYLLAQEELLQQALGTKVEIMQGRKRGKIYLEFYSREDLERICARIKGESNE
ncbi:MAG: ParB/RepB/Spo0J family partition protein, partial [Candidatus Omnitrophica bacterium]|nr:ParB/RepB/Spo0J family partition protein [Candidatus Omnitrophota bacterium]